MAPVYDDEVAIILSIRAIISRLCFHAATDRQRDFRRDIRILGIKIRSFPEWNQGRAGVRLKHTDAEIHTQLPGSPATRSGQPVNHRRGLRIDGRLTHVLRPDGSAAGVCSLGAGVEAPASRPPVAGVDALPALPRPPP